MRMHYKLANVCPEILGGPCGSRLPIAGPDCSAMTAMISAMSEVTKFPASCTYLAVRLISVLAIIVLTLSQTVAADAASGPVCPTGGKKPNPDYSAVGAKPNTTVWKNVRLSAENGCSGISQVTAKLVISLAGQFKVRGSVETLAERIGAISSTKGMLYWSVTDGRMRVLIKESFVLSGTDPTARRRDFSAKEVLAGKQLYFAQDDTRSTGINVYGLKTISADPDHVSFEIVNETAIKVGPITLFAPRTVRSRHFFSRVSGNLWSYYGLTVIEKGQTFGLTQSLINRGVALYRHLSH